jgi:hypothetical protein
MMDKIYSIISWRMFGGSEWVRDTRFGNEHGDDLMMRSLFRKVVAYT